MLAPGRSLGWLGAAVLLIFFRFSCFPGFVDICFGCSYIPRNGCQRMEKASFGERLKREREARGVSLEEVSAATRISTRFLKALENQQWDRLPGGVFNRGFIRAVARFLGLDEESLLADYASATNDLPALAGTAKARAKPRRTIWPWIVVLVVAVLVAAGWLTSRRFGATTGNVGESSRPAGRAAHPATPRTSARSSLPASQPSAASKPAAPPLKLKVEAGRTTHLSVVADGKSIFDGEIKRGESHVFEAQEQFRVSAGDSSAVLVKLNGRAILPLGPPEQPGSVTLTREELKQLEGSPL